MRTSETLPSIAAVVVGWNYRDDSVACIHSILNADYPALQIWFVDNGSTDGSPALVHQQFPEVIVIELGENRGLVGGYNAGILAALEANVEYMCVFNND